MKKYLLVFCIFFLSCILPYSRAVANIDHAPSFIAGTSQSITFCENTGANSIDSALAIIDSDAGQQEIWSVVLNATHGTLVATDTATSTGGIIVPSGLTYMPAAGYSGTDSFIVQISDSLDTTTTTIYVTVIALPTAGVITGGNEVCVGGSRDLADTAAGGSWSALNGKATISSTGSLHGVAVGMDSILYTVTNTCGTAIDTSVITVHTIPSAGVITGIDSVCSGSVDTLSDAVTGGIWHSGNAIIASVNADGDVTGVLPGSTTITYIVSNACGTDTARATVKVQIPLPASGSIIAPSTICQLSTPALLVDIVPGGTWSSSNFLVAAVIGPAVEGITPGTATITYTLHNACGTTTATQEITVLSTAECAAGVSAATTVVAEGIHVYPDPNNGTFTFNFSSPNDESVKVSVTNVTGMKVKEFTSVSNREMQVQMDVPAGLYFITASAESGKCTEKLIVR